ncbi:Peptidoglycan-associated lipoprotein [Emticicia aquatica]|jgi:OOP family OmpA-OmpF porin|uniref:Peptidoglycan-associated lipoprotein n=1 Tax=Emticicia aquatica TaxID=1681835 RepID=A0ABM9AP85_9BACT|nr:OmpA family protein [Emticicia aquatica]CAH0995439.1 Peptidoglycan-associated lipoprotein [Emticicia aquatica]
MNRLLLFLLILLWSLAYSWFWNCKRKPFCTEELAVVTLADSTNSTVVSTPEATLADTIKKITPEEQIVFKPLDVYFAVNQSGIDKTAEVDSFLTIAKKYFEKYPDKQLLITGHTDSDGSEELNQRLSENRAKQTQSFLVKEGFKASQIVTEGKGENEPLAPNDTPEGKSKNRRSTIRLK